MSPDRVTADQRRRVLLHQPNLARGAANWVEPTDEELSPEPPAPTSSLPVFRVGAALAIVAATILLIWGPARALASAASDRISGWATGIQDEAAAAVETEVPPTVVLGDSASSLLVFTDGDRAAFVLMAVAPDGAAHAYVAPQTLLEIVPGYGEFDLSQAYEFNGGVWVATTITNATGLRIDDVVEIPVSRLRTALGGTIPITVPSDLIVVEDDASVRIVGTGTQELDADLLIRLMVEPGTGSQFDWVRRQGAAFDAVMAEVARREEAAAAMMPSAPDVAGQIVTFATSGTATGTLPVERTAVAAGIDAFVLDRQGVADLVDTELAHLKIREGTRPRVEVLNGTGRIGATREIAGALARRGFQVILTDNAGSFDFEVTQIIAQGRDSEQAAREVAAALGAGELFLEVRAPSGVVDVSIIVGDDIATGE